MVKTQIKNRRINHYGIREFYSYVWNEAIERELERLCVFVEDCNRKYEGKIKNKGESVTILGVGKPTIKSIAKSSRNADIDGPEEIEDTLQDTMGR